MSLYEISEIVREAVEQSVKEIFKDYGPNRRLQGEEVTAKLEIAIKKNIEIRNGNNPGFEIKTTIFNKQIEETTLGADLAVFFKLESHNNCICKVFLSQAKRCLLIDNCISSSNDVKRAKKQAKKMLGITSDSFFFIYTPEWIYVCPALEALFSLKEYGKLSFSFISFKRIENFFSDFVKCFVGDIRPLDRSDILNKFRDEDVNEFLGKNKIPRALLITAKLRDSL